MSPQEVNFSPDSRFITVIYLPDQVHIYDAKGRLIRQFMVAQANLMSFETSVFSQDGQKFACLWLEGRLQAGVSYWQQWVGVYWQYYYQYRYQYRVCVWRTSDWKLEHSVSLPLMTTPVPFQNRTLSFDAALVALPQPDPSGWDGFLWRLECLVTPLFARLMGSRAGLPSPPFQVVVHRLKDGQLVAKLPRFGQNVSDIVFSPDGRYLAVSHGSTIALWEWKGSAR